MIQKSTYNALANVSNHFQGKAKRILCVCSAGMLRSPTIAHVLATEYGYNTRAAGTSDYALIPLNEALIAWADELVFADDEHLRAIASNLDLTKINFQVLNIPDYYERMAPALIQMIKEKYIVSEN